mgnify:CR=1 FL=1
MGEAAETSRRGAFGATDSHGDVRGMSIPMGIVRLEGDNPLDPLARNPSMDHLPLPYLLRARMRSPGSALAGCALAFALLSLPVRAQSGDHPSIALLPAEEEAALARSAAPPEIGQSATVWVLGADGLTLHAEGSNGWGCLVERDHPESLAPQCYDPEGTRTLVPGVLRLEELRAGGMGYVEAMARVEADYRSGALPRPDRPVLSYMLSPEQRLHAAPDGPAVGAWKPHVMIWDPRFSNDDMALPEGGLASVRIVGPVFTYLVVPVARWSDGSLVEG